MNRLATLGPKGTFSELAALKFIQSSEEPYEIEYFSSIKNALNSVGSGCDIAVLPIENFSEGFVSLVLDYLMNSDLTIVSEIILPIRFAFVTNTREKSEINRLFVQFVAKGQCSEFIETLGDVNVISTESNIESLDLILSDPINSSAIVPADSFDMSQFNTVVEDVNDHKNNQTRFLAFSKNRTETEIHRFTNWKTSLVILGHDRPGFLAEILACFASRGVNLTSIISRPTKVEFGRYNFLIDINGHAEDEAVADAINEISQIARVKSMGSYPASHHS